MAIFDRSYGIIPLKKEHNIWYVLLIQHSSAHFWGFPKGHPEKDEAPKNAAIRELKEETNLDVSQFLSQSVLEQQYFFTHQGNLINKTVNYFIAEVSGKLVLQEIEVSGAEWLPFDSALQKLTYESDKTILKQAQDEINHFHDTQS